MVSLLSIASVIVLGLIVLLCLFTALKKNGAPNDRGNKVQEVIQNEEKEEAQFEITYQECDDGSYTVIILNSGQAAARDIRLDFPDGMKGVKPHSVNAIFPLESLVPGVPVSISATPQFGNEPEHTIRITWLEKSGQLRDKTVTLAI